MLAAYGDLRAKRIAALPKHQAAQAKLVFVGLQQRLLSSIAAFARTLKVHRRSLQAALDGTKDGPASAAAAEAFAAGPPTFDQMPLGLEEEAAESAIEADEEAAAKAATALGARNAPVEQLRAELQAVDEMLAVAEQHATKPDARVRWLVEWIGSHMAPGGRWNERRLDPLHGIRGHAPLVGAAPARGVCRH